jgi:hypothetical protein
MQIIETFVIFSSVEFKCSLFKGFKGGYAKPHRNIKLHFENKKKYLSP